MNQCANAVASQLRMWDRTGPLARI